MVLDMIMVKDIVKQAIPPHLTRAMFHSVNFSSLLFQGARNDVVRWRCISLAQKGNISILLPTQNLPKAYNIFIIKPSHTRGQPIKIQHTIEISSEMYAS